jgi:hypothetical protein
MEAFLFDLNVLLAALHDRACQFRVRLTSCDLAAVRASLPGFEKAKALGFRSVRRETVLVEC